MDGRNNPPWTMTKARWPTASAAKNIDQNPMNYAKVLETLLKWITLFETKT